MADEEDQQSTEPVEVQGLTREQKAQALGVTLQGLDALERQVSSGRLPTQPAPRPAPPAPQMQPGGAPGYEFGRGIGVLQPPAQAPAPAPQGRTYMGPASGPALDTFTAGQGPSNVNLMPPQAAPPPGQQAAMQGRIAAATGGESDAATLARLQASDRPGSTTIGTRSEPKYSDASMANQQNAMRYEAMKKFDAGDHSPEVLAAAMGRSMWPMRNQTATKTPPRWMPADPKTGRPGYFESSTGTVHVVPAQKEKTDVGKGLEAKSLYTQQATLVGQIASPNTSPKKVPALQTQLDAVNARIKELFPSNSGSRNPSDAAPANPIQPPTQSRGALTREKAKDFLSQARGDKAKARQLARDAGYEL